MLWGRARKAIRQLHPLHRALVEQKGFTATLPPAGWQELIGLLAGHTTVLPQRRWALPEGLWTTVVPLLRVLSQDVTPTGAITVQLDLRGPQAHGKAGWLVETGPGVRDQFVVDPWLLLQAKLRDGSRLQLRLTTRTRHRTIRRRNPRGKVKVKNRMRQVEVVTVTRTLAPGQPLVRPAGPPPPWVAVRLRTDPKVVLRAVAKVPPPRGREEADLVLAVISEVFRWTPPRHAVGAGGRPA